MDKLQRYLDSAAIQISHQNNKSRGIFLKQQFVKQLMTKLKDIDDFALIEQYIKLAREDSRSFLLSWTKGIHSSVQKIKQELSEICCNKVGLPKDQEVIQLVRSSIHTQNYDLLGKKLSLLLGEQKSSQAIQKLKEFIHQKPNINQQQTIVTKYSQIQLQQIRKNLQKLKYYSLSSSDIEIIYKGVIQDDFQPLKKIISKTCDNEDEAEQIQSQVRELITKSLSSQTNTQALNKLVSQQPQKTQQKPRLPNLKNQISKMLQNINSLVAFPLNSFAQRFQLINLRIQTPICQLPFQVELQEIQNEVEEMLKNYNVQEGSDIQQVHDQKDHNIQIQDKKVSQKDQKDRDVHYAFFMIKSKKLKKEDLQNKRFISLTPHKKNNLNVDCSLKIKNFENVFCFSFIIDPKQQYTISFLNSDKEYTQKIKGSQYSNLKFNFIFDLKFDLESSFFQKVNDFRFFVHLFIFAPKQSILQFTLDFLFTLEKNAQLKKGIVNSIGDKQYQLVKTFNQYYNSTTPYLFCVIACLYSEYIMDIRPSSTSTIFENFQKIINFCPKSTLQRLSEQRFQQLKKYHILLQEAVLKVRYFYAQSALSLAEINKLFIKLLIKNSNECLDFLIKLLHVDYRRCDNHNKTKKIKSTDFYMQMMDVLKDLKCSQVQRLYYQLIFYLHCLEGSTQKPRISTYISSIFKNIREMNEQSTPRDFRNADQYKKNILAQSQKIFNQYYKMSEFSQTYEFIKCLQYLSESVWNCVKSSQLENVIFNNLIYQVLNYKTKESIFLIATLFLSNKRQIIPSSKFLTAIQYLFLYEKRKDEYIKSFNLGVIELQVYITYIVYCVIRRSNNSQQNTKLCNFALQCINQNWDIQSVLYCINQGLITQQKQEYRFQNFLQKTFFPNVLKRCQQLKIFDLIQFVSLNKFRLVISLQPILKNFLTNYIVQQSKKIVCGEGVMLSDVLLNKTIENHEFSQQDKDDLLFRLIDFKSPDSLTLQKVRQVILIRHQNLKAYLRALNRCPTDIQDNLRKHLSKVAVEINQGKINYQTLKTLSDLKSAQNYKLLTNLFTQAGIIFQNILQQIQKKSSKFQTQIKQIQRMSKNYKYIISIMKIWEIAHQKITSFKKQKHLNFDYPKELLPLLNLDKKVVTILGYPDFVKNNTFDPIMSVQTFCQKAIEIVNKLAFQIIQILDSYREEKLTLQRLCKITKDHREEEIRNLFNLGKNISPQQMQQIILISKLSKQKEQLCRTCDSILFFAQIFNNSQMQVQLKKFSIELQQNKQILCKDFVNIAQKIKKYAQTYKISSGYVKQVIQECYKSQELIQSMKKTTMEQIEELDDYLTDQEESYINSKNINEYKFVYKLVQDIFTSKTFEEFIDKLYYLLEHSGDYQSSLKESLSSCQKFLTNFSQLIKEAKDRESSFKYNVMDIMKNSRIKIEYHQNLQRKQVQVIFSSERTNQKTKKCSLSQLNSWRDKSLLLINSSKKEREKNQEQMAILKLFTILFESLNSLLKTYNKLENLGYFNNFVDKNCIKSKEFLIYNQDFKEIQQHRKNVQQQCNQIWEPRINVALPQSFALCHFQGRQLKKLADQIFNYQYSPVLQRILCKQNGNLVSKEEFFQHLKHGALKNRRDAAVFSYNATDKLSIIIELLRKFERSSSLNKTDIWKGEEKDRVTTIKFVLIQESNLFYGISAAKNLISINMPQILFCRQSTTFYELKTFLFRALHNPTNPYFMIGIKYLSLSSQNDFCTLIQSFVQNQSLKKGVREMNLYLINSSTSQKIYNFISNSKKIKLSKVDTSQIQNYWIQQSGKFNIVHSKHAGLGKTFWIQQKVKAEGLQIKYFPVSGNFTIERLYQRLQKLGLNEKSALVIQIHNVKNYRILDQFLFQIIIYKCVKTQGFHYLPPNLRIFIELENIKFDHFQNYQILRMFKNSSDIVKELGFIQVENIKINQGDLELMFVLYNLDLFDKKQTDKYELSYQNFLKNRNSEKYKINQARGRKLLDTYFLQSFKSQNIKPSYIQLRSFVSIIFESIKLFCSSIYFSVAVFDELAIKNFRTKYFELLLRNAKDFLNRTVTQDDFEQGGNSKQQRQKFHLQLRQFPLLVMPNSDQQTFSFVYKNHKQVDIIVKKYILLQQHIIKNQGQFNNTKLIEQLFQSKSLNALKNQELSKQLLKILFLIANPQRGVDIKNDMDYSLTLDNFFKMCLIIQRMRARIPIIIMGQTGVGKTALIRFLVQNIFDDKLELFNIHAGVNENQLIQMVKKMKQNGQEAKLKGKKLWVFFDEFNTSEELGYIKEIVMDNRFLGEQLGNEFVFICACNPFRNSQDKRQSQKIGFSKQFKSSQGQLIKYKVLRPPKSMIQCMWDYQDLKDKQSQQYIKAILQNLQYRPLQVSKIIHYTHQKFKRDIQKSAVNLRDVSRFKILFYWFLKYMPSSKDIDDKNDYSDNRIFNYRIQREERAFILSYCFCYYMRLQSFQKRRQNLIKVQTEMGYKQAYMKKVLMNEQIDYLCRMDKPNDIAMNEALRQNMFASLVCIMNKLPIIIVGMPGCSKTLSIKLLLSSLRGKNSSNSFFQNLPEVKPVYFQGSQTCSSDGVEKTFVKAQKMLVQNPKNVIPMILFDEIGLAELSQHNPLKVLHSHLQINRTKVSFVGLSNWELDASKMARFLIINRPIPDKNSLNETAQQIFKDIQHNEKGSHSLRFQQEIRGLAFSYSQFIQTWKSDKDNSHPDFFGLRDFYSLIKYTSRKLIFIDDNNEKLIQEILITAVQRNFDGRPDSIKIFLKILREQIEDFTFSNEVCDIQKLISDSIQDKHSRCLLQIIKGQSLVYLLSKKQSGQSLKQIVSIHGSTFQKDRHSDQYILYMISDIINYVGKGNIIILKDMPNTVQTSLYDLLNKSFYKIGQKQYCRVTVGDSFNPRCLVHSNFNCIVYIMENRLGEVDPPFLNRFQKHYLTLDKFLREQQIHLLQSLQSWLLDVLRQSKNKQYCLFKQHYFINVCTQSLASLAIKLVMENPKKNAAELLSMAKKILINNTTVDFKLYLEAEGSSLKKEDLQFLQQSLLQKNTFITEQLQKVNYLIVYTYDQNVPHMQENILSPKIVTKTIKLFQIKCEKDLRNQLQKFYSNQKYQTCQIIIDYERQSNHLCLIIFLVDSFFKKFQKTKRICIILMISRVSLLQKAQERQKQVSYLNGYTEIFIESLQKNVVNVDQLPKNGSKLHQLFHLQSIIPEIVSRSIKRFNFTYASEKQKSNLVQFGQILLGLSQKSLFIEQCKKWIINRWKNSQNLPKKNDWKKQLLINKQILNLAQNTKSAMKLYFENLFEDWVSSFLMWLIQNEVIYCFDYNISKTILCSYIPGVNENLPGMNNNEFQKQYQELFRTLLEQLVPGEKTNVKKISRATGEERCVLSFPKLFPFSKKQRQYLLKSQKSLDEVEKQNQIKDEETFESICGKLESLEKQAHLSNVQNSLAQFTSLTKQGYNFINYKTKLKIQKSNGQYENLIQKMNTDIQLSQFRKLFLFDIRNCFLKNFVHNQIQQSFAFEKILQKFKMQNTTIEDQLFIMLRAKNLWSKLICILQVFRDLEKSEFMQYFCQDQQQKQKILSQTDIKDDLDLYNKILNFTKNFFDNCAKYLDPTQQNIDLMGGFTKSQKIFNNMYYILQELQYEYRKFGITINPKLRLMKNFMKTLQTIAGEKWNLLYQKFLKTNNLNLYRRIHQFLECVKKQKQYLQKTPFISKYQANTLFRYYLQSILKSQLPDKTNQNHFIQQFIRLVNNEENFAHCCINVIAILFMNFVDFSSEASQMIENLTQDNLDGLLLQFNKNIQQDKFNNNLAVVLVDFFCKHMMKSPHDEEQFEKPINNDKILLEPLGRYLKEFTLLVNKKEQRQLNSLQTVIMLSFSRIFLIYYIESLEGLQQNINCDQMVAIDQILQKDTDISKNLRIYCLKILRNKTKSIKQLKIKYLDVQKAKWLSLMKQHFVEVPGKQFLIPPEISPQEKIDLLLDSFKKTNYNKMQLLQKTFQFKSSNCRYKLFNFFLTEIYTNVCGDAQRQIVNEFLAKEHNNLQKFQLQILRKYAHGKISQKIFYNSQADISILNTHIWLMNSINWIMSIRSIQSPLSSIFFEDGKTPKIFSKHIQNQFLLCGSDNRYRSIMQNTKITLPNNVGVYICSKKCDFMYTIEGCGWPSVKGKCSLCYSDIAGTGHQLLRYQEQGARRVGPNLLFSHKQFQKQNDYKSTNTNYSPFYVGNLQPIQVYWKCLAIYIQKEIQRVIQAKQTQTLEQQQVKPGQIILKSCIDKLTGYTRFNSEGISRIHSITNSIINIILNSIFYVWLQAEFISAEQCQLTFDGRNIEDMKKYFFQSLQKNSQTLKTFLSIQDWQCWLMGMQKEIFGLAINFKKQVQKQKTNIKNRSQQIKKQIQQTKKSLKDATHRQLLQKIVNQGVIFKTPNPQKLTAEICWNRDLLQKIIQNVIIKNCSGEDKISFTKKSKNTKGHALYPFEEVLLEQQLSLEQNIKKWQYIRVLRLAENPSIQHMNKQYSMIITKDYPILDLLLNNTQKLETINHFYNIISFVNQISQFVNFRVSRQIAKSTKIVDFIKKQLKLQESQKEKLLKKLHNCLLSWNYLSSKVGNVQYQCKSLGNMSNQYSEESYLINFLFDQLEQQNYFGKMMGGIFHLFGVEVNEFINNVQAKKNTIPALRDVQLFSQTKHKPQKILDHDIVKLSKQQYLTLIMSLSSNFVKYGNGIPLYDFEVMQHKLTTKLYGKKRMITDIKQFNNIQFSGEAFTRMGKYSNYLTQVRQAGANKQLPNIQIIQQKFQSIKKKNQNNFYNTMKQFQGFIEKLMIFYKNLQDKGISLGDFVLKYNFKNPPDIILELPFRELPIECLVSLYEVGQKAIRYKIWDILPQKYRSQQITSRQKQDLRDALRLLKKGSANMPTFDQFKNAFCRFAARCLILGQAQQKDSLDQYLISRADFWPYQYSEQRLSGLSIFSIPLSKAVNFYKMIQGPNDVQRPRAVINEEVVTNVARRPMNMARGRFQVIDF